MIHLIVFTLEPPRLNGCQKCHYPMTLSDDSSHFWNLNFSNVHVHIISIRDVTQIRLTKKKLVLLSSHSASTTTFEKKVWFSPYGCIDESALNRSFYTDQFLDDKKRTTTISISASISILPPAKSSKIENQQKRLRFIRVSATDKRSAWQRGVNCSSTRAPR